MSATAIKLSVRQWAEEDRPSTKLQNLGVQALSDSELLSILIGSGTTQHNAVEIGSMILSNFDRDLAKLSKADGTFARPLLCHGHLQLHAPEDAGFEGGGGARHPHESEF